MPNGMMKSSVLGGALLALAGGCHTARSGGRIAPVDGAPVVDAGSVHGGAGGATAADAASPSRDAVADATPPDATADLHDAGTARTDGPPFTVAPGLFDQTKPADLGLPVAAGTQTVTIFRPSATTDHYSNGVVLVAFKGWLYAQWQSSATDEDAPDTWVAYSRSSDGINWSPPAVLAERWDQGIRTNGGWWVAGDTLVAYVNVWPTATVPRGGTTELTTSTDGVTWSARKSLPTSAGTPLTAVFEQDPRLLPNGQRILGAAHFQPGLLAAPCYTDDLTGMTGWRRAVFTNLPHTGDVSRELEPSWFARGDGALVMVFRDQNSTYRRLASISIDRGASWSMPVVTDMPDSRAKQSAGNLPDGAAFQVGNPVPTNVRIPLVVTLSRDGQVFDKAFALRRGGADLQAQRYPGTAKTLGYSYPKSMVWQGSLYVGYATNKEDVEYTRVPLASLAY
jgi:hypothetical protein